MPTAKRTPCLVLLAAIALILAACGQPPSPEPVPDQPPEPVPDQPSEPHPNSVLVQVTGLPNELEPDLALSTPTGSWLSLRESRRLDDAAPGEYRLTANQRQYYVTDFTALPPTISGTLTVGSSLTLTAAYAPDRNALKLAVARLNEYRTSAGLEPVAGAPNQSLPQWLHARYAAHNRTFGHSEDPSLPWYTLDGHDAARVSNISYTWRSWHPSNPPPPELHPRTGADWVDALAAAPYHMFSMMVPQGESMRFAWFGTQHDLGEWYEARSVAALQITTSGDWPEGVTVYFPGAGTTIELSSFWSESPNPLANCPGYEAPAGLPIFVMTGPPGGEFRELPNGDWHYHPNSAPSITSTTLTRHSAPVEHCAFDANSDTNGSRYSHPYGAVVLIPRQPLEPSSTYQVRFATDQGTFEWSFRTASELVRRVSVSGGNTWQGPPQTADTYMHADQAVSRE